MEVRERARRRVDPGDRAPSGHAESGDVSRDRASLRGATRLLTTDTSARRSRKNAAKCDNSGELQLARILEALNANRAPVSRPGRVRPSVENTNPPPRARDRGPREPRPGARRPRPRPDRRPAGGGAAPSQLRTTVRGSRDDPRPPRPRRRPYRPDPSTSDRARPPAEFKHINKRRKRNQPGCPQ